MSGAAVTASLVGKNVGEYRLEERLGTGTYGVTYRARHIEHRRIVALKLMHEHLSGDAGQRANFESEMMKLGRIEHPSIVTVVKYGEHDGQPWVASEWLEGETLASLIERGGLPVATALNVVRQLLAALASAHSARLAHRNVKPSNVILERRAGQARDRVKLMDFAPELQGVSVPILTGMATPYSAPELASGDPLDARSDVFGAGATLIAMLNGVERGKDKTASVPRGLTGMHARSVPGVDASLVTWIRRATSVHRAMRFSDAADALRELIDLLPRDVRSPSQLNEAASGTRALSEARVSRPTTKPVAPLPVLKSMSRSEIPPPPPSRFAALVTVPKAAPTPSLEAEAVASDEGPKPLEGPKALEKPRPLEKPFFIENASECPEEEPELASPKTSTTPVGLQFLPIDPEPLIPLSVRAESARGTLRPIEKRIANAISEPRVVPLMAAAVFAFLIVALGVFLHGNSKSAAKPERRDQPEEAEEVAEADRAEKAPLPPAPSAKPATPAPSAKPAAAKPTPAPSPATYAANTSAAASTPAPAATAPAPIEMPAAPPVAAPTPNPPPAPSRPATIVVAGPGRPPVRDPWQEPAPQFLKRWHELARNGAEGGEGTVKALREYNRDHPNDVRGYIVIGLLYLNRFWRADAVEAFSEALERDPTARGAPDVLPTLLDMVEQGKAPAPAMRLIQKAYGSEALDPIDQAFGEIRNPEYAARLHQLRLKLMEAQPAASR